MLDEQGEVTLDADLEERLAGYGVELEIVEQQERVTIEIDERVIRVTSQSRSAAVVDYGKNQANVETVIAALVRLLGRSDLSG